MSKKKHKHKVKYYDDESTIVDMSDVGAFGKKERKPNEKKLNSNFRSKWDTYWAAVRMMILPMFFVLGVLAVLYVILRLIAG